MDSETSGQKRSSDKKQQMMAPMFVFLSSSLNVELVYSILKGVTSFGYITLMEDFHSVKAKKIERIAPTVIGDGIRITIRRIKIKDKRNWD